MLVKYNSNFFKGDLIGGFSVAAISLPVAVAYAEIAHLPPEVGIYTAIFAFLCYFFLGSSKELILGPDSATTTLFATVILTMAAGNNDLNLQFAVLVTVATGILMVIAGFLKLGFIANFLSKPILLGYLNGISLILIIYQLGKFTGIKLDNGYSYLAVWEVATKINLLHFPTLIIGVVSLVIIRILKKISIKIPAQLILIILAVLCVSIFKLGSTGIKFTEEVKDAYPVFVLPDLNIFTKHFLEIIIAAASLLFVSYSSEIPVAHSFTKDKYALKPNREFFAMGIADIVIGFFRGFPVSGADSRTAVNVAVGGKTKMVNIFAAIILLVIIIFFSKEFALIPSVVFGAVIVNAAVGMFKLRDLFDIRKFSKMEYRVAIICMIGVLLMGVYQGIILALILTMFQLIGRGSKPDEYELVYDRANNASAILNDENKNLLLNDVLIFRYNSSLFFFNSDNFREKILERARGKPDLKTIIIDARPINYIDITSMYNIKNIIQEFNERNVKVVFVGLKDKYMKIISRKLKESNMDENIFNPNVRSYFS